MRKVFVLLGFLFFIAPGAMAAFDKTLVLSCVFVVTCPSGDVVHVYQEYDKCTTGWGFCFNNGRCGSMSLADACYGYGDGGNGGSGSGGPGGGDECLFDPFHCNPFST